MSDLTRLGPEGPGPAVGPPRLGRRALLRWLGAGAAAFAATAGGAKSVLGQATTPVGTPSAKGDAENGSADQPKRLRRWVMAIDLRRCDGCADEGKPPQCTQACIQMRMVPEPMEWIEIYERELPGGGTQFLPTPCMQCQNAPCVNVCPVGATFATPEGIVLIDQERCIGCRLCMAACPYQRRFFNWGEPVVPQESLFADYNVESQIPARRGTVMKCDFCGERPRQGNLPYCIVACPHQALYYGDEEEDLATNGREVVKLSRFLTDNNAFRLKEELGTKPSVYYIPGHGEAVGRHSSDPKKPLAREWPWGKARQAAAKAGKAG